MNYSDRDLPLVSIIITSYNRAGYIGQAIESALMQDYPVLEVIIIDNCSTDDSDSVIKKYTGDQRVRYIKNEKNLGLIGNFQKAIVSIAKGDYLSFISSDDYLTDEAFVTRSVALFSKYDKVVMVTGGSVSFFDGADTYEPFDSVGYREEIRPGKDIFSEFQSGNTPIGFDACVISNKMLKGIEVCYDPEMTSLDFEIGLKLCLRGNIAFIDKPCYAFRIHNNQASKTYGDESLCANIRIIDRAKAFAVKEGVFTGSELDKWYTSIIYNFMRHNYMKKYLQDFGEYKNFKMVFSAKYPGVFKKIRKERGILLLKCVYNRHYNLLGLLKYIKHANYKTAVDLRNNLQ